MGLIPISVAVVFVLVLVFVMAIRDRANFEKRFPPISDEEFLTLCKPGVNREVALKVRRLVADHFAIPYDRVYPSMSFIEDLGAD